MQQKVGTSVTNYLWDEASTSGDVVQETDGNGVTQASYVLGDDELLAQTRSGAVSYYLDDGQGSVRTLTNSSGGITDSYRYDAFGNLQSSQGITTNSYLYTGQQFDSLTGLYDLRARYYDPSTGRFLSRDTASADSSNPAELNGYSYTYNDPINGIDPSGHFVLDEDSAILLEDAGILIGTAAPSVYETGAGLVIAALVGADIGEIIGVLVLALERQQQGQAAPGTGTQVGTSAPPTTATAPQPQPVPPPVATATDDQKKEPCIFRADYGRYTVPGADGTIPTPGQAARVVDLDPHRIVDWVTGLSFSVSRPKSKRVPFIAYKPSMLLEQGYSLRYDGGQTAADIRTGDVPPKAANYPQKDYPGLYQPPTPGDLFTGHNLSPDHVSLWLPDAPGGWAGDQWNDWRQEAAASFYELGTASWYADYLYGLKVDPNECPN